MNRKKKNLVYPVAFFLILGISIVYRVFLKGNLDSIIPFTGNNGVVVKKTEETLTSETFPEAENITAETSSVMIDVYICGAVIDPGVYEIPKGAILNDVVEMAGGFAEDAAKERLDLVYVLETNLSIYIPTYDEVRNGYSDRYGMIRTDNGMCSIDQTGDDISEDDNGLININTASKEQLITLPGIGEAMADAIIEYRTDHRFETVEDIMQVSGIGESKFNRIRDLICV